MAVPNNVAEILPNDRQIENLVRMSRVRFDELVDRVHGLVELSQEPLNVDFSLSLQLAVCCTRLGIRLVQQDDAQIGEIYGVTASQVKVFTLQGIRFILRLESSLQAWPSQAERDEMKAVAPQNSLFKDCIGFIDIRDFDVPTDDYDWTEAEEESSTSVDGFADGFISKSLFITDHRNRIRFSSHGWPGGMTHEEVLGAEESIADARRLFGPDEYLITRHPISPSPFIIPQIPSPPTPLESSFNRCLRRNAGKGVNALLDQWKSLENTSKLKEYGMGKEDMAEWLQACCLLTNYTLDGFLDNKNGDQVNVVAHQIIPPGSRRAFLVAQLDNTQH